VYIFVEQEDYRHGFVSDIWIDALIDGWTNRIGILTHWHDTIISSSRFSSNNIITLYSKKKI